MRILVILLIEFIILSNSQQTNWFDCPVYSDGKKDEGHVRAQCLYLNVPVDWNEKLDNNKIQIFVKRYFLFEKMNTSHQLWRIAGGGGIPISSLESEAVRIVNHSNGDISVYATDKRGVGNSSFFECPLSVFANFSACLPFIQENQYRLQHNTITNMARDLYYVLSIVANRKNLVANQRIILMGSSQGTYVLQRYLHLIANEKQIDAIILDSVVPTDYIDFPRYDRNLDFIFQDLFIRCAQDTNNCAGKFENHNPLQALYTYKINEDLQENTSCLALLNTNSRDMGIRMAYLFFPTVMQIFPALIYRINRCNDNDKKVLRHFIQQTTTNFIYDRPGYSMLIALNNDLTELWSRKDPTNIELSCEYIRGMSDNTFAAMQLMSDTYCPIYQQQVLRYSTDQYYAKYPKLNFPLPLLVLHGDMDASLPLPLARHFYKRYSSLNSNATLIELPRTGHTATDQSPVFDNQIPCGWQLVFSFVLSPNFQSDRSCLEKILPIDFAGQTQISKQVSKELFGQENLWD